MSRFVLGLVVASVFAAAPAAASTGPVSDTIAGVEGLSANISTTGNFAGVATGQLPGLWAATVNHVPLTYTPGTQTPITGGTFTLKGIGGVTLSGAISGGSVTPTVLPGGCGNQVFTISATVQGVGSFIGVLTHYRTSIFGACVTYGASVTGSAALNTP